MKNKVNFAKKDVLVVLGCVVFLLTSLGALGSSGRERAKRSVCLNNLKQLALAWIMYADDNYSRLIGGWPARGQYEWVQPPSTLGPYSIELEKQGIRNGALFGYVQTTGLYHCPSDIRRFGFRSFSIAGGMNGEGEFFGVEAIKFYDEIKSPATKYVFVEEADPRGWGVGSWVLDPRVNNQWVDPLAIWHNGKSNLGFADGHAETHRWVDKSTLEMATFYMHVPPGKGEDLRYMQKGYAYKALK